MKELIYDFYIRIRFWFRHPFRFLGPDGYLYPLRCKKCSHWDPEHGCVCHGFK